MEYIIKKILKEHDESTNRYIDIVVDDIIKTQLQFTEDDGAVMFWFDTTQQEIDDDDLFYHGLIDIKKWRGLEPERSTWDEWFVHLLEEKYGIDNPMMQQSVYYRLINYLLKRLKSNPRNAR
jgi:hypothetical protein